MPKLKPTYRNILKALADNEGWVPGFRLLDGNGRAGCARGEVLSAMKAEGLISYGKDPQHSLNGWKITDAGCAALAAGQ